MSAEAVQEAYTTSLWYAWGISDSGTVDGLTLDHGWKFARSRKADRECFEDGRSCTFGSMMGDWKAFLSAEGLASV